MKVTKSIKAATNSVNVPSELDTVTGQGTDAKDMSALPDRTRAAEYIQLAIDELGKLSDKESREAIANLAVILMDIK